MEQRVSNIPTSHYPFILEPLPYTYDALEPHIDRKTLKDHHQVFSKGYIDRLNKALMPYPQLYNYTLLQLLRNINGLPEEIQRTVHNNAGGAYNHQLYFSGLTPNQTEPSQLVLQIINQSFGDFQQFKAALKTQALDRFGSGWAMVVLNPSGRLQLFGVANQDTSAPYNICPILAVDVWEHAYIPQYLSNRDSYFENWFQVIDWREVEARLLACQNGLPRV